MEKKQIDYDLIVDMRDTRNIMLLEKWVKESEHRAENCGCPGCIKEHQAAQKFAKDYLQLLLNTPTMKEDNNTRIIKYKGPWT